MTADELRRRDVAPAPVVPAWMLDATPPDAIAVVRAAQLRAERAPVTDLGDAWALDELDGQFWSDGDDDVDELDGQFWSDGDDGAGL